MCVCVCVCVCVCIIPVFMDIYIQNAYIACRSVCRFESNCQKTLI